MSRLDRIPEDELTKLKRIEREFKEFKSLVLERLNINAFGIAGSGFKPEGLPLYYFADDTFVKADYPGLKAIWVEMVGGGGAGGGSATTGATQGSFGNGGNGGSYSRAYIPVSGLDASEAITVGQGGTGASGTTGGTGTASSLTTTGAAITAAGGAGGGTAAASSATAVGTPGANASSLGDISIHGGQDCSGWRGVNGVEGWGGAGGSSMFAPPKHLRSAATNGVAGHSYGGGGTGTFNDASQGTARTGGDGADGLVIIVLLF